MKPFVQKQLEQSGGLKKLLNLGQPSNALIELNNLLAITEIGRDIARDIESIEDNYKFKLRAKCKNQIEMIFKEYLSYNLIEPSPTQASEYAPILARALGVADARAAELHKEVGLTLLKAAYENAIADNVLSQEDEEWLDAYQKLLKVSDFDKDKISEAVRSSKVQALVDSITKDGQISPDEEQQLAEISRNLKVEVQYDEKSGRALEKMRLRWRINNSELPMIDVGINLPKKECCYLVQDVNWYEYRKERQGVNYRGVTGRVKIAKGLYYRYGSLSGNAPSKDVLTRIDSGKVYLTNKKLLFVGSLKNITIPLQKIIDVKGYNNGVDISKESGKSPFLEFGEDVDIFTAILLRAISEANG